MNTNLEYTWFQKLDDRFESPTWSRHVFLKQTRTTNVEVVSIYEYQILKNTFEKLFKCGEAPPVLAVKFTTVATVAKHIKHITCHVMGSLG